jgi:hypothetical protein
LFDANDAAYGVADADYNLKADGRSRFFPGNRKRNEIEIFPAARDDPMRQETWWLSGRDPFARAQALQAGVEICGDASFSISIPAEG